MRTATPAPPVQVPPTDATGRLERWAWLMLPALLVALLVANLLGALFMHLLGLHQGDLLLMAGGAGAWAAELLVTLVVATPPVAGVTLATLALRRGARRRVWAALVLNAFLVAWVLYVVPVMVFFFRPPRVRKPAAAPAPVASAAR